MTQATEVRLHRGMRVAVWLCIIGALPAVASAQDAPPPPPPSYGASAQPVPAPPPPPVPAPPTASASAVPSSTLAPIGAPVILPSPDAPSGPPRRSSAEIAELASVEGLLGGFATVSVLVDAGVTDPLLYSSLPMLGASLMLGGVVLMDGGPHLEAGVPTAISTGTEIGFGEGLLLWNAIDGHLDTPSVLSLLVATSAGGTVLGGLAGFGLGPSVADSRLVASTALWGGWTAWMTTLALGTNGTTAGRATLGASGGAALLGVLLAAVSHVRMEDVLAFDGMAFSGLLVGLSIGGSLAAADRSGGGAQPLFASLAIGSGAGVGMGLIALLFLDAHRRHGRRDGVIAERDIAFGAVPVRGGGYVTARLAL